MLITRAFRSASVPAAPVARVVQRDEPEGTGTAEADDVLVGTVVAGGAAGERALALLHDRYSAAVYGLALRVTGNPRDAEEVLQDAFWSVWRCAAGYEPGRVRFATWLLRVAHNGAVSVLRRRQRRPVTSSLTPTRAAETDAHGDAAPAPGDALPDPGADVPELAYLAGLRATVAGALLALPAVQRQAVELAYFGGLTHAAIAVSQGAPVSTVKTRLALGLKKLACALATEREAA